MSILLELVELLHLKVSHDFFLSQGYYNSLILITSEKMIMKFFNQLCLMVIVLVFIGCSSKTAEFCEGDLKKCAPNEDCHCWK